MEGRKKEMNFVQSNPSFFARRTILISLRLVIFVIGICLASFAQDEIVFRTFLFKGFQTGSKLNPTQAKAFSAESPKLPMRMKTSDPMENEIDSMREVIGSVYRIPNVVFLTSATLRWDGKRENINETVQYLMDIYPIQIYPKIVSQNRIHLKIEGFKFEFEKLSFIEERSRMSRAVALSGGYQQFIDTNKIENSVGGEKWLDQELDVDLNTPVLLALSAEDRSLFLALQVLRKDERKMDIGFMGNRLLSCSIGGTDPVCGKTVRKGGGDDKADELRASIKYKGETYFFCSEECLDKFKESPDRYLKNVKMRRSVKSNLMESPSPRPKLIVIPEWPTSGRKDRWDIVASVKFDVDSDGRVQGTQVFKFADVQLESAFQETLRQWAFEPKIQNGKPVSSAYSMDLVIPPAKAKQQEIQENKSDLVPESSGILARIADYCSKLENAALYFVSRERIVEDINSSSQLMNMWITVGDRIKGHGDTLMGSEDARGENNVLSYDYQLIRKDNRIQEIRILMTVNDKNVADDHIYPKTKRFYVDKAVFGPIGFFDREAHSIYQYRLLKDGTYNGNPVYIIEVKPKNIVTQKLIYGKAWADQKNGAILRMEIDAESFSDYERISADYESQGLSPSISFEIVYGFENNGLRFPSHVGLKESYYGVKVSELTVDYDRYKFFTVGTEVKYQ
jgi:TonB family protein